MSVETATYPSQLNTSWPLDTDTRREGASHIRTTKTTIKNWAKKIDGTDFSAGSGLANHIYPIGAVYAGLPQAGSNPGDDIGGIWGFAGQIAVDQSTVGIGGGPTPPALGSGVGTIKALWVWVRTA